MWRSPPHPIAAGTYAVIKRVCDQEAGPHWGFWGAGVNLPASGSAPNAVGTPRLTGPVVAGHMYRAPCSTNSSRLGRTGDHSPRAGATARPHATARFTLACTSDALMANAVPSAA